MEANPLWFGMLHDYNMDLRFRENAWHLVA
jgi:hypothetical protein